MVSPDVASKLGVTCSRGVKGQLASPDVASKRGVTCLRGVKEPHGVARCGVTCPRGVREPHGVARCGIKTWRDLLTRRQGSQLISADISHR